MGSGQQQNPNEYDLKIDAQVEKFLVTKQKLTYFLITASVAIIAFLANFIIKYWGEVGDIVWIVIFSSIAGLLTSGFSLLNLHLELKSYKLHLEYRYKKKDWDSLTDNEKEDWNKVNIQAALFLKTAFVFLFIEIAYAVTFFVFLFLKK